MYSSVENSSSSVPAFLIKLWSLVEDPSTDELIHWDSGGTSFHVYDQQRFSREILPLYFKHSNIASFIRQLNMYGFRKVTHIDQGGLKIEKDDLQFQHQFFQKGERDMLQYIKRKVSNPLVRPATDTLVNPNADEVSRVLTDMKQVKGKQENMEQNLEYIKRENKLLWREVALLRQKHHKQQQIVNKLIQFLVSLVSSSRTGITIPGLRRMPLAINDTSQVQAQQAQQQSYAQIITDPGTENTSLASLIQENLLPSGSSIVGIQNKNSMKQETQSVDDAEFIIDEGNYTIESPKGDVLLSPTPSLGGPIIHELPDVLPANGAQVGNNVVAEPVVINNQGQLFSKSGAHPNIILRSNQPTTIAASGSGKASDNFLMVPQLSSQPQMNTARSSVISSVHPSSVSSTLQSHIPSPASTVLMSPKIEPGPSLEDALNFGLDIPSSNISTLVKSASTQSKVSLLPDNTISLLPNVNNKRPGDKALQESNSSPSKKPMMMEARVIPQPKTVNASSPTLFTKPKAQNISSAQADSLHNLVQASSDLNTPGTSSLTQAPFFTNNQNNVTDAMALAAAGSNKEGDDPMLASEQLDLLSSDLDGLKGILQDQYKVDPNFLMELFEISNPWNLEADAEKDLELKTGSDKGAASTSAEAIENVTGQELVEYNPQDTLFPELLMGDDSLVGDIDDID